MATFGEVQDRIKLDYLNRSDLSAETTRAIGAAIRKYERQRFFFNESSTAVATVAAQSHVATQAAFFTTDYLRFFYEASASYELTRVDMKDLLQMRGGNQATGQPTHYAVYGERYELFPVPDSAWTVTVHGVHQLASASVDSQTTDWFSAAEDLIVYSATKLMWANVLRNREEAAIYAELEADAFKVLRGDTEQRMIHAIKATRF